MSECEYWEELMSEMLDDEIEPEDAAALRNHMRTCKNCQATWNILFSISHTIQKDIVQPPASLASGVMAQIRAEEARDRVRARAASGAGRHRKTGRSRTAWIKWAAAACLVIVIGAVAFSAIGGRGLFNTDNLTIRSSETMQLSEAYDADEDARSGDTMEEVTEDAEMETGDVTEDVLVGSAMDAEDDAGEEEAAQEDSGAGLKESRLLGAAGTSVYDLDGNYLGYIATENEAAFTALLNTTSYDESETVLEYICSIEYNGVIYLFSTDQDGQRLFWQDAAEGAPFCSTSSVDDLWAIIY